MTAIEDAIFHHRQPDPQKLTAYGFTHQGEQWRYAEPLTPGFTLTVTIAGKTVSDADSGAPYTLHLDPANTGMFVGRIRGAYVAALTTIAKDCFDPNLFAGGQMKQMTTAIEAAFAEHPEYLWQQFPNNAIIRRSDNRKWYALLVTVTPDKVGHDPIDLLVLRAGPQTIQTQLKMARRCRHTI